MNYESIEKAIGVVILGQFHPQQFTKDNLLSLNIIKQEENGLTRYDVADDFHVVFNVGNLRALCDRFRFQLLTNDIVMSPRLVLFCQDLVNTIGIKDVRGLGLNSHIMISLSNEVDEETFRIKLIPPVDDWNILSGGGDIKNVIFKHEDRTISLSPATGNNEKRCYEFNVNKHHSLDKIVDVLSVLDRANEYFANELNALESFIQGL